MTAYTSTIHSHDRMVDAEASRWNADNCCRHRLIEFPFAIANSKEICTDNRTSMRECWVSSNFRCVIRFQPHREDVYWCRYRSVSCNIIQRSMLSIYHTLCSASTLQICSLCCVERPYHICTCVSVFRVCVCVPAAYPERYVLHAVAHHVYL